MRERGAHRRATVLCGHFRHGPVLYRQEERAALVVAEPARRAPAPRSSLCDHEDSANALQQADWPMGEAFSARLVGGYVAALEPRAGE